MTAESSANSKAAGAATLRERDARVIANIARLRFSPLCLVGGSGNRLIEEGGRRLLDLSASFGPAILGYSHPAIIEAVTQACAGMAGACLPALPNENAVALAEDLLRLTPGGGERRVWFGHSGSDSCPPSQVAAIFIEPLMSDGGLIVPPPGFLEAIQQRCRRHGILIVVDEVKVGLGRSGKMHCFEHEGLTPDLVVFGKGLGGGLPLSAVIGPRHIMDHAPAFALQTTAGNPVAAAAGRAVLKTIADEGLIERAVRVGAVLSGGLRALSARHEMIGDVRGRGLAVGVDLVSDRASRQPVPVATTAKVIYRAYQLGAVFFYVGLKGNVLEFTPPLTLSEAEAEEGVALVDQALTDVTKGLVSDADVAPFMMW
jgi:4-aminobutyrate aminotransferase